MADTSALESLAELIPAERRERFFRIAAKFRDVSEDDDHLQMLEAVGFMTLVMEKIPDRVAALLDGARTALGTEDAERLRAEVTEILTESLDTPSYKDLREAVRSIREQEHRFERKVDDLHKSLTDVERRPANPSDPWQASSAACSVGSWSPSLPGHASVSSICRPLLDQLRCLKGWLPMPSFTAAGNWST